MITKAKKLVSQIYSQLQNENSRFIKYLHNIFWLVSEKILQIGAGLFIGIWLAKYLGPERLGLLSYSQSVVALFIPFATLGIHAILSKELIKKITSPEELIANAIAIIIAGEILAYFLLKIFLVISNVKNPELNIIEVIGLTIFGQIAIVFEVYFQSELKSKNIATTSLISLTISSIIKIILILFKAPLILFAFSYVIDGLVILLCYSFFLKRNNDIKLGKMRISFKNIKNLLKESWPLLLGSLLTSIYWKIDQVMLKMFLGDYEVGQYSVAARLSEALYFLPVAIVLALNPAIVNAKEHNSSEYKKRMRNLYSLMIYISVPMSVITYLASDLIIMVLFGKEYYASSKVLQIHIWASVFVFVGVASGRWLVTEGIQIYLTLNQGLGALSNILLNLILIPKYGIEGAAWATLFSYALAGYFSFWIWKKTREQFWIITTSCFYLPKYK